MLAVMVLFSATIIYLVESQDNVPTLQHSLWLAIVTVTTVGYGDFYPESSWGYLVVSLLTFISVLFLAMPVGIIGHEFTQSLIQFSGKAVCVSAFPQLYKVDLVSPTAVSSSDCFAQRPCEYLVIPLQDGRLAALAKNADPCTKPQAQKPLFIANLASLEPLSCGRLVKLWPLFLGP